MVAFIKNNNNYFHINFKYDNYFKQKEVPSLDGFFPHHINVLNYCSTYCYYALVNKLYII